MIKTLDIFMVTGYRGASTLTCEQLFVVTLYLEGMGHVLKNHGYEVPNVDSYINEMLKDAKKLSTKSVLLTEDMKA